MGRRWPRGAALACAAIVVVSGWTGAVMADDIVVQRRVFPAAVMGSDGIIASPFQFYVTGEDNLEITTCNSVSGCRVVVHVRFLEDGVSVPNAYAIEHTPNSDRTMRTTRHALGRGALLNLRVSASAGAPRIGQTFAIVRVIRGMTTQAVALGTLVQGYVTERQDRAWPGSPIEDSISGGGVIRTVIGTNPPAGSEIAETVPAGARWELLGMHAGFVASAAVADRRIRLLWASGGSQLGMTVDNDLVTAGLSPDCYWMINALQDTSADGDQRMLFLPPGLLLLAGHTLSTTTTNLQAGDNWGAPTLTVREWLEVDQ